MNTSLRKEVTRIQKNLEGADSRPHLPSGVQQCSARSSFAATSKPRPHSNRCPVGRRGGAERYKLMTPDRRMRIASSMFETARAIIESSLPVNLTRRARRPAFAKRLHAGELPDAALLPFAEWNG
jgi:hypothetical protein